MPSFGDSNHLIQKALEASLARHEGRGEGEGSYLLIRSAVQAALNNTGNTEGNKENGNQNMDEDDGVNTLKISWRKGNTLVLVGLVSLCLGLAALLTGLYLRAVQDKNQSQATLKSLIKFLSDEEKRRKSQENSSNSDGEAGPNHNDDTPTFDYKILDPPPHLLPSRLTLAPLEGDSILRLPAPQSSHAPLPSIGARKPGRRERRKYEELNPSTLQGNPAADTLEQMFARNNKGAENPPNYEDLLN